MICFGCLQPKKGEHNETSCKNSLSCTTCNEKHFTTLRGYIPKNKIFTGDSKLIIKRSKGS